MRPSHHAIVYPSQVDFFQLGTDISLHHVVGTEGSRQSFGWGKGGPLALYRENDGAKVLDRRERERKEPPVVLPF